jgi:predicted DNA-binding protein (MmcQ/YjbR family)
VFESKLSIPKLSTKAKRGLSGYYMSKDNLLVVSPKSNISLYEIWGTFTHEMVHVYQHQINHLVEQSWDPASGAHGKSFWRWREPLREIAGVQLTQLHDLSSLEVEDTEDKTTTKNKKMFYVLFVKSENAEGKRINLACKSDKLENLVSAKNAIRAKYGMNAKYYTRMVVANPLLEPVTSYKANTGTAVLKLNNFCYSRLSDSVFDNLLKLAKPVE